MAKIGLHGLPSELFLFKVPLEFDLDDVEEHQSALQIDGVSQDAPLEDALALLVIVLQEKVQRNDFLAAGAAAYLVLV